MRSFLRCFLVGAVLSSLSIMADQPPQTPTPHLSDQPPQTSPPKKKHTYSHKKTPPAIKTPSEVEEDILLAQKNLVVAQQMFIPWYTGPLITGSANNVPRGRVNVQSYVYFFIQYARFNHERHSIGIKNLYTLNPLILLQTGISDWLDFTLNAQGFFRWQDKHSTAQFGDTAITFGFQLAQETRLIPAIRLTLGESFPTGKYQHLSHTQGGIDGTGAGAFITNFGLNISKIFWWFPTHPINLRLSTTYSVPDNRVPVSSFNFYGGGYGTRGKVLLGQTFNGDLGIEFSINQKWVLATDIVYSCSQKSTFGGTHGVTSTGAVAPVGFPSSDNLSISPAIEYNVSQNGGFIGGVWIALTGRNSANFTALVLSYTYLF